MCRSTPRLAGRRKTVPARIDWREQVSTTTWPTRTASRKPICSCIASIGRLGRSRSYYDHGSRDGDRLSLPKTPKALKSLEFCDNGIRADEIEGLFAQLSVCKPNGLGASLNQDLKEIPANAIRTQLSRPHPRLEGSHRRRGPWLQQRVVLRLPDALQ